MEERATTALPARRSSQFLSRTPVPGQASLKTTACLRTPLRHRRGSWPADGFPYELQ